MLKMDSNMQDNLFNFKNKILRISKDRIFNSKERSKIITEIKISYSNKIREDLTKIR